jgi:hypothetical protein
MATVCAGTLSLMDAIQMIRRICAMGLLLMEIVLLYCLIFLVMKITWRYGL